MVKIKDFTLASKNRGGRAPGPTELPTMTIDIDLFKSISENSTMTID